MSLLFSVRLYHTFILFALSGHVIHLFKNRLLIQQA